MNLTIHTDFQEYVSVGDSEVTNRRLATVLISDVYGFSTEVSQREERIEIRLANDMSAFRSIISDCDGQVVADRGDGLKATFDSPVRALRAATQMQTLALKRNSEAGGNDVRMRHRIGIHVGDMITVGDSVGGLIVTITARLEQICPPGKICFSDAVHQMTSHEGGLLRTFKGTEYLKNLDQPVKVWIGRIAGDFEQTYSKDYETKQIEQRIRVESRISTEKRHRVRTRLSATLVIAIASISTYAGWKAWVSHGSVAKANTSGSHLNIKTLKRTTRH